MNFRVMQPARCALNRIVRFGVRVTETQILPYLLPQTMNVAEKINKQVQRPGQSHLISSGEDLQKVVWIPARLIALDLDSFRSSCLLLQEAEGKPSNDPQVLRRVLSAHAAVVLLEGYVKRPVELVFDAGVVADGFQEPLRVRL